MRILKVLGVCSLIYLVVVPAYPQAKMGAPPDGTAIPISFTHTINTRKERQGDRITAKTMQVVLYDLGTIDKGSLVFGHIVDASYTAKDGPSTLTIKFDRIVGRA
jgi:hypothetical protein